MAKINTNPQRLPLNKSIEIAIALTSPTLPTSKDFKTTFESTIKKEIYKNKHKYIKLSDNRVG